MLSHFVIAGPKNRQPPPPFRADKITARELEAEKAGGRGLPRPVD